MNKYELTNIFKKISTAFFKILDDLLLISGMVAIIIGVSKIYIPAGYIILGICLIIFAFLVAKKGG